MAEPRPIGADDIAETARTITARRNYACTGWHCTTLIRPGEDYARYTVFPGHLAHDGPGPLSLAVCQDCATLGGRPMPPRWKEPAMGEADLDYLACKEAQGTTAGYSRHRRRGQRPCKPCADAHVADVLRYRAPATGLQVKLRGSSLEEKLSLNVRHDGDCLRWTGAHIPTGYGQIKVGGSIRPVHRVAYEVHKGEIPDGFEIDHVWALGCRFKDCIKLDHLEAVNHAENVRRAWEVRRAG